MSHVGVGVARRRERQQQVLDALSRQTAVRHGGKGGQFTDDELVTILPQLVEKLPQSPHQCAQTGRSRETVRQRVIEHPPVRAAGHIFAHGEHANGSHQCLGDPVEGSLLRLRARVLSQFVEQPGDVLRESSFDQITQSPPGGGLHVLRNSAAGVVHYG